MKKLILSALVLLSVLTGHAQYHIDSTFNATGTTVFDQYAGNVVNGKQVAYTDQNEIIVAGRWNTNLTIWKYKQDGSMDLSFGQNGMNYFDLSIFNADVWVIVKDIEIQDDGKIVVLADAILFSSNYDYTQSSIVLARFNADGTADTDFNNTGLLITKPDSNFNYNSRCLDIDDATKQVYVGGTVTEYGSYSCPLGSGAWFVANFAADGTYDLTFNSSGYLQGNADLLAQTFVTQTPMAIVLDVKALPDDQLLFVGTLNYMDQAMYTARLTATGTFDNTYFSTGRKTVQNTSYHFPSSDLTYATILEDGSSLFHVQMPVGANQDSVDFSIQKFTVSGDPDLTFGTNGFRTFNELGTWVRMSIDTNDRLIYAWYNITGTEQYANFRRLMPDGSNDASFGYQGYYRHLPVANETHMTPSYCEDFAINPSNDDLTLIAYRSSTDVPNGSFRILNYHVDDVKENLSVETLVGNENVLLYPNPGNGKLSVEVPVSSRYSLFSANGSQIMVGELKSGINTFDWSDQLINGLYFMQFETETGLYFTMKISIEE